MHQYYLLYRPPGYAHMPDGYATFEVWHPPKSIPDAPAWHAYGWVKYPFRLDDQLIWKWEFLPADPLERNLYRWWLHEGRDADQALVMREDYLRQGKWWLEKRAGRDFLAELALEYLLLTEGQHERHSNT